MLKKILIALAVLALWLAGGFYLLAHQATPAPAAPLVGESGTISTLDQFTSTSSPATAITQRTYGKAFRLSGQSTGCATFSSNGTLTSNGVACGSGSGSGGLASTSPWVVGQLTYVASNSAITSVATGTVSATGPLNVSATRYVVGGALTLSIDNAAADGSTKGAASFTAADFNASSGNISLDYTNGQKATASVPGFLSSADWTVFNNKISSTSLSASAPLAYNSSTGAFTITQAGAAANGYLSSTDWNIFNNKISSTSLSGTGGITYNSSSGVIGCTVASGSAAGCLASADWTTFNGKESVLSFVYPLVRATNSISLAFGTTTANTWALVQTFTKALVVNENATSTFTGAISVSGWALSTSTTVCRAPEHCQYQANSTTADTAIQAAITYITNAGGGTVYIKAGTYTLNAPITIVGSGIRIQGEGNHATILVLKNSFNDYAIKVDGAALRERLEFRNFKVDGNNANQTSGGCIMATSTARSTFDTMWLEACKVEALKLAGPTAGGFGYNNTVSNSYIANNQYGIVMVNNDENHIFDNTINSSSVYHIWDQQGLQDIHNNTFTGVVYSTGVGIYSYFTQNSRYVNNTFDSVPQESIKVLCNTTTQGHHQITGNYFFTSDFSGTGKATIQVDGCVGNQITNNYSDPTTKAPYFYQEVNNASIGTYFNANVVSATSTAYNYAITANASTTNWFTSATTTPPAATYWAQINSTGGLQHNVPTNYGHLFSVNGSTIATINASGLTLAGVSDGCATFTSGLLGSTGTACASSGGGTWPFTPTTYSGVAVQSTSTPLWLKATSPFSLIASSTLTNNASTTLFTASGSTWLNTGAGLLQSSSAGLVSAYGSTGLVLTTSGVAAAYAGSTCTNQFARSTNASGVWTCATVGAADVALANLTATNSTLTFSGTYDGSTARTIGLNLGNANTWTALQQFSLASSTVFSAYNSFFGGSATTTIDTAGNLTVGGWLNIPKAANPTIDVSGKLGIDTTAASTSLRYHDGTAERAIYDIKSKSFLVASSTLAYNGAFGAAGTTTLLMWNPLHPITVVSVYCKSDVGTAKLNFNDGTNKTDLVACSTTPTLTSISTNATWVMLEDFKVDIGTSATAPNRFTITVNYRETVE